MEIIKSNNGGLSLFVGEEFKGMIKGVSKFFMMVVFFGIIMFWIMMLIFIYCNKWFFYMCLKFGVLIYFGFLGL